MRKWYFTFGLGHTNRNCYAVIPGAWDTARAEAVRRYGHQWSMQYSDTEWILADGRTQAERWNLKEIDK